MTAQPSWITSDANELSSQHKGRPFFSDVISLLSRSISMARKGTRAGLTLEAPLFPAAIGKTRTLSRRPLVRTDAADILKRRHKQAGLLAHYSPHSFRATGITNFFGKWRSPNSRVTRGHLTYLPLEQIRQGSRPNHPLTSRHSDLSLFFPLAKLHDLRRQ
jgi:hypothetical protein